MAGADAGMSLGQRAARSGVPGTTLRYYDRIGLLPAPRLANGHRRYGGDALGRLRLIQLCRGVGCTLDEVAVVLAPGATEIRRTVAATKLAQIDRRMHELARARSVLAHLAECDHGPDGTEACRATVAALLAR